MENERQVTLKSKSKLILNGFFPNFKLIKQISLKNGC